MTAHPFRDKAPFLLLTETPPTSSYSLRFSHILLNFCCLCHLLPDGGISRFMRSRSRMAIDPRVPTMLLRSTSGFRRPGRHRVPTKREAPRGIRRASWRVSRVLPKNHLSDRLRHLARTFLHIGRQLRINLFAFSWCGHFQRQQWG